MGKRLVKGTIAVSSYYITILIHKILYFWYQVSVMTDNHLLKLIFICSHHMHPLSLSLLSSIQNSLNYI